MLFNRHFFIVVFSILFIGVIFWWQKPETAVSALARGDYSASPYSTVKNYWKKLDYRQFDIALTMTADTAQRAHDTLQKKLSSNPLLSIQKIEIIDTLVPNVFQVKATMGSVINPKQEYSYIVQVGYSDRGWMITSITQIE